MFGVPSERYGEEVAAWVKRAPGAGATPEALLTACGGRIATYKIPRYCKFVDAFPMTVSGKAQKFRMREVTTAELGVDHRHRMTPKQPAPTRTHPAAAADLQASAITPTFPCSADVVGS